jgi:hypothetical protein
MGDWRDATITTRGKVGSLERGRAELLAEALVAVEHMLGAGSEDDDQALEELSRVVWVELVRECREDGECAQ